MITMQILAITTILLFATVNNVEALSQQYGRCEYTGDPHLIPFPPVANQTMNKYLCQRSGWEILLQNKYVLILVEVGPAPYLIINYQVTFLDPQYNTAPCILSTISGMTTCPVGSPVTSSSNPSNTVFNHWYAWAQNFHLQIEYAPWGNYYNIYIRQSMNLIKQSSGVCVRWSCVLEQILAPTPPPIIKICSTYLEAATKWVNTEINPLTARHINIQCQNDVALTAEPKYARTVVRQVILAAIDNLEGEAYFNGIKRLETSIEEVTKQADTTVTRLFANGGGCWNYSRCFNIDPVIVVTRRPFPIIDIPFKP